MQSYSNKTRLSTLPSKQKQKYGLVLQQSTEIITIDEQWRILSFSIWKKTDLKSLESILRDPQWSLHEDVYVSIYHDYLMAVVLSSRKEAKSNS